MSELSRLRRLVGASAALWAGRDGVRIEPGRWLALSGAPSPSYNLALCDDAAQLQPTLDELETRRTPAILITAGAARHDTDQLAHRGWAEVAEMPFMTLNLPPPEHPSTDPAVRRLTRQELPAARTLIADAFELGTLAETALPTTLFDTPDQALWGTYDTNGQLATCVATVTIENTLTIWSLATHTDHRRQGLGRRTMHAVHAAATPQTSTALLYAPLSAETFYHALGYRTIERWRLWSRPRWMFATL